MAAKSTHELTAAKQIKIGPGVVCALTVVTNGAADASVALYDVAAAGNIAAGNKLTEITIVAANNYGGRTWVEPVIFSAGLYATVSGAGASYFVEWRN
jgi:hypothetical protein